MIGVIVIVVLLAIVLVWALNVKGPGVGQGTGTSIKRGSASHRNIDGTPKRAYGSLEDAQSAAARQGSREHAQFSAYRCRDCGKYHVGHSR